MPSSPSLRRLLKEIHELTAHPSPHFTAGPISDSNLYDWHFTLAGPPAPSPYASGIYHGRITFPATYPLRPPSFRFLTPSGRFEVNREICLSISGHHEETWQPAWGVRTALLAIRSFMDADPKGQVGGLDVEDSVRRRYAGSSRAWRCESCFSGGKTNEEILREWRLGNGLGLGEDVEEGDVGIHIHTGVDVACKDEMAGKKEEEVVEEEEEESIATATTVDSASSTHSPSQPTHATTITSSPSSTSNIDSQPQPRIPTTTSQQQQQHRSSDTPWLDRAIIGVLIALVLMILRRVSNADDL